MRILGKVFENEDLVLKVLRFPYWNWKPKVNVISKSRNLSYMNLTILFGNLQEHGMELKILTDDEEGIKKKNKILAIKVTNIKYMESNEEDY